MALSANAQRITTGNNNFNGDCGNLDTENDWNNNGTGYGFGLASKMIRSHSEIIDLNAFIFCFFQS